MDRRVAAASVCGAVALALPAACGANGTGTHLTGEREGQNLAAAATNQTSTLLPRQEPAAAVTAAAAVPTPGPVNRPTPALSQRVARWTPVAFALGRSGYVAISYQNTNGDREAWRLYGPHNRLIAEAYGASSPGAAGQGFILQKGTSLVFLDRVGRLTRVRTAARRPIRRGDVALHGGSAIDFHHMQFFTGTARPNGVVTHVDGSGRLWALGTHTPGRTVIRSAVPGGAWTSRTLGPWIGAERVSGAGKLLTVTGMDRMYLSPNGGHTWRLLRHGACVYSGTPSFAVTSDGSILGGDFRCTYRISHDLETFHTLTETQARAALGYVSARRHRGRLQLSVDGGAHWHRFTIPGLRCALRHQATFS